MYPANSLTTIPGYFIFRNFLLFIYSETPLHTILDYIVFSYLILFIFLLEVSDRYFLYFPLSTCLFTKISFSPETITPHLNISYYQISMHSSSSSDNLQYTPKAANSATATCTTSVMSQIRVIPILERA